MAGLRLLYKKSSLCLRLIINSVVRTLTWEVRDRELQVSAWVLVQNQNRLQQIHGKKACLRMLVKALAENRAKNWIRDYPKPLKTCTLDIYSLWAKFGSGVIKVHLKDWARPVKQTSSLKSFFCSLLFKPSLWAACWLQSSIAVYVVCLCKYWKKGRCLGSWATTEHWGVGTTEMANLFVLLAVCRGWTTLS